MKRYTALALQGEVSEGRAVMGEWPEAVIRADPAFVRALASKLCPDRHALLAAVRTNVPRASTD